ncbi:hypothetical protein Pmani_038857 [Petrolisthes manimaculis]|uniref:Uncharacterized protein n=1 Tax=Petrolisthes manimaculis TaxID=1843537 RepID=A0AAE1NDK2_9EUCA|nr:hypothetical protein Pmani_038857 [Petrolisthes manimaculis]
MYPGLVVIKPERVLTPSSSTMRLLTALSSLLLVALCLPYQSDSISRHEEEITTTSAAFILEEAYNSIPQQDKTNNSFATTKTNNHQVCQDFTRLLNEATVLLLSSRTLVRFTHLMGIQPFFPNYTMEQVASLGSEVGVEGNSTVHNLIEMAESELEKYPGAAQLCLQTYADENLGEVKVVPRVSRSMSVQNLNLVPVLKYLRNKIVWFNIKVASLIAGVRTWLKYNG